MLDNKIEQEIRKLVRETKLDQPSSDFTNNLLYKVEGKNQTVTELPPLISKRGWILISVLTILSIVLGLLGSAPVKPSLKFSFDYTELFTSINKIVGKLSLYVLPVLALLFLQMTLVTKFFSRNRVSGF